MYRLIEFIKRIYVIVLFLLLEGVALWNYAQSSPYTEAKILSRTTAVGGAISSAISSVEHFFSLPSMNRTLTERVAELSQQVEMFSSSSDGVGVVAGCDSVQYDPHFKYHPARVVSMTTSRQRNFVVLDRGFEDGISKDMGVVTPDNKLVGYVVSCSEHYSVVQPMLSVEFSTGGRLVENDHVCVIRWSGKSKYLVEAVELSVYSEPKEGMEVEVSSERLPSGVLIGKIVGFELNSAKSAYSAEIEIAADISRLDNVLIVENSHAKELEELKSEVGM